MTTANRSRRVALWFAGVALAVAVTTALSVIWWAVPPRHAGAQAAPPSPTTSITVIGDGTAKAEPDAMMIRLGVLRSGKTPAAALAQTRQAADQILQQLRTHGVADLDMQTSWLNVSPVWGNNSGGPPDPANITGYQGNAAITVHLQALARIEAVLDAAMQAGASSVDGLSFDLRDDSALRQQALQAAIKDARPKAEVAAKAAGVTLGGVRSVVEVAGGAKPMLEGIGMGGAGGVAPGQLGVTVRAEVTFDVGT